MASREEEKRLRREERQRAEAAAAASAARSKRLQFLLGALLTIAVVAGAVFLIAGSGGDDGGGEGGQPASSSEGAPIPAPAERDLDASVEAAGCELSSPPLGASSHVAEDVDYPDPPPTSGNHSEQPALDGIYEPGNSPKPENWLHSMEHGRIVFAYGADTPPNVIAQLETLVSEPLNGKDAYKVLLLRYDEEMPYAVAAVAWGQRLGCERTSDAMFDALRNFRLRYVDKGPEAGIPPNN